MASVISAGTTSTTALNLSGDTTGILQLQTNGTTAAMTINTSQQVGIGTSSPSSILHIASSSQPTFKILYTAQREYGLTVTGGATTDGLAIRDESGSAEIARFCRSGNVGIGTTSTSGARLVIRGAGTTSATASFEAANSSGNTRLYVQDDGTTRFFGASFSETMRIDSSGRVGIGTASPTYTLEVATGTSGQQSVANFRTADSTAANNAGIQIFATPSATAGSRNVLVSWDADGADTSGGDYFYIQKLGNSGNVELAQYSNAAMIFSTNVGTERMRITSGGNLLVGTTTGSFHVLQSTQSGNYATGIYNQSGTSPYALLLSLPSVTGGAGGGFLTCVDNTNRLLIAGNGNVTNTNGSYGTISDIKNKENIVDATPKLDKVNQLKVRNYNFIGDDLKQIGFVAQEFEQVFPSMVEEHHDKDADGNDLGTTTKSIKTSVLVPILVKAIQELNAKVEAQAAEIQALKGAR